MKKDKAKVNQETVMRETRRVRKMISDEVNRIVDSAERVAGNEGLAKVGGDAYWELLGVFIALHSELCSMVETSLIANHDAIVKGCKEIHIPTILGILAKSKDSGVVCLDSLISRRGAENQTIH